MAKTPFVDERNCIRCGICVCYVPTVFRRKEQGGLAECYDPQGASEEDIHKDAMRMCPVRCIHWQQ